MRRRKRASLRKLKRRFLLGAPLSMEAVLDTPKLDAFVRRYGYRMNKRGNYLVRA